MLRGVRVATIPTSRICGMLQAFGQAAKATLNLL
jgi:hypothetical protein